MNLDRILADLRAERDRLDRALSALAGINMDGAARPAGGARRGSRGFSAAMRKRLSLLMKQRWAERKKRGKSKL